MEERSGNSQATEPQAGAIIIKWETNCLAVGRVGGRSMRSVDTAPGMECWSLLLSGGLGVYSGYSFWDIMFFFAGELRGPTSFYISSGDVVKRFFRDVR